MTVRHYGKVTRDSGGTGRFPCGALVAGLAGSATDVAQVTCEPCKRAMSDDQHDRICPHNDRVWIICWPSEHGLVPVESSCRLHLKDAWTHMEGGQALSEERGFVAKRFWLSLTKPV